MTRADLVARARAAAESWDDRSSDLLLELADALEAERRDAVAYLRTRAPLSAVLAPLQNAAAGIERGDHEGASS